MLDLESLTLEAYTVAVEAGEAIMGFYRQTEPLVPEFKADASPLTVADQASHEILAKGLAKLRFEGQAIPLLSEEGPQYSFMERQKWHQYWCVDPLDGTKDFLRRNDEFTVNIALVHDHIPIIGIIYVPAQQKGYLAWEKGGAYRCEKGEAKQRIATKRPFSKPVRVAVSRYHGLETLQPYLTTLGETVLIHQGSALKFCTVALGEADIFLRLSPSSEWDNAAGQCLIQETGGAVYSFDGQPLSYNRSGTLEQRPFIAVADSAFDWQKALNRHGQP